MKTSTDERQAADASWLTKERALAIQRWALIGAWGLEILLFTYLVPDVFLTYRNFSSIFGSQTILVVLTLGLMIPLTTGDYDLSVGGTMSLSAMIIAVLNVQQGWPVSLAVVVALVVGAGIGVVNGVLVVGLGIESLIITLAMGTIALGLTLWISSSQTVSGVSQSLIDSVVATQLFGINIQFYYGLGIATAIWYVYRYTSLGRRMLFTGQGPRVAELNGVAVGRVRFGSLVVAGVLAAFAGVLYIGTSGGANPGAGTPLLLPAFAAAFLGTTAVEPGRFNPFGTVIAVYFLSTGITGLSLMGYSSFVQNLFYGGSLIVAVVLSKLVWRRFIGQQIGE